MEQAMKPTEESAGIFSFTDIALLTRAIKLVDYVIQHPDNLVREPLTHHELAVTIGYAMDLPVATGYWCGSYVPVPHSWLETKNDRHQCIIDVATMYRLPRVQLLAVDAMHGEYRKNGYLPVDGAEDALLRKEFVDKFRLLAKEFHRSKRSAP